MLNFIHIAKTGGTSFEQFLKDSNLKFKSYHLVKPDYPINEKDKYLILLRNPLKRFVSAFNYYFSLIDQDLNKIYSNNLSLDNCLSPYFTHKKLINNYYFSKDIDENIIFFQNANKLAESLSSDDLYLRNKAIEICNYSHFLGFGFYLDNGEFLKKYKDNIIWVGKLETINSDIDKLKNILNIKTDLSLKKLRENKNSFSNLLSEKAINNLIHFYNDDYKTLDVLYNLNFIDHETLESYKKY